MALDKIHLRKLLRLFEAPPNLTISLLRKDIREEAQKEAHKKAGDSSKARDFYGCFWADAKAHVAGVGDLKQLTAARVQDSKHRARLYPLLADGFIKWWDEKRRWRNEPINIIPQTVSKHFPVPGTGCVVKVENLVALDVAGEFNRILYPYFSDVPPLTIGTAKIGLWVLGEALTNYRPEELRLLERFAQCLVWHCRSPA